MKKLRYFQVLIAKLKHKKDRFKILKSILQLNS